jgi:hypothetical protein
MKKSEVVKYVESQKSLHLYKNIQDAFIEVLGCLTDAEFEKVKKYLIIMAFHDGIYGQVMHFPARKNDFAVMQLYIPKNIPSDVLRWVVAHELGYVMQNRNWIESDGIELEIDATEFAKRLGYPETSKITKWLSTENP